MTPEQLKLSILQTAFQGKLTVKGLPNETSDELYQQIQAEKQRLIKEKKIKKEKPLPDIPVEDIPFDIPENWRWCYVGDLFLHNTGKAQNSSGSTNGTIRKFITTSNLYWGEFDFTKVKEMPFTDAELGRCTVKKGDLLVCEGGDCGRSAVWSYDEEVCIQNHVHRLRPYRDVNIYYFYYLFYLYKNTGRLRGRGVAIQGLSNEAIHKVVLPLAPLKEQYRIVAKIEELLPYVDRYAAAYEKLEQFNAKFPEDIKKSILQYAIQGKLVEQRPEEGTGEELYRQIQAEKQRLIKEGKIKKEKPLAEISEDEIPFDIPENWKWCRLRDICTKIVDGDHNPPAGVKQPTDYLMLSATNINNDTLVDLSKVRYITQEVFKVENQRTRVEINDVFFTIVGSMGRSCVYKGGYNLCFQRSVSVITTLVMPEFLKYVLDTPYIQFFMYANATGTAQKGFYLNQVENLVVPIPSLAEQHRIVAKLEEILPLCEQLK